ncbi:hypothetical protein DPEC_G00103620 [Dallia pectoralis]|uniref:Uncharacterized protein n=1 Tax=Dallia pectoralis TaxID=75939 RepID=A0ACC2GX94_DALPE|nr:hypothetical protein DPEC_G00103620 [Dallia pectoralis]
MDVYADAVDYLETEHIPVNNGEQGTDVLEDDVFPDDQIGTESIDIPETPHSPKAMLDRRLMVLRAIMDSEKIYLYELETLLMPMKALKASAGTSKPVLSSQHVQTVFYQVPELRDLHRDFYTLLRERMEPAPEPERGMELEDGKETELKGLQLTVGDLFLKIGSHSVMLFTFISRYQTHTVILFPGYRIRSCK